MKKLLSVMLAAVLLFSNFGVVTASAQEGYKHGVDISEHNGDFDLAAQKNDSSDFVMIRLGYFTYLDKQFLNNVKKAYEAQMNFGVYLYSYAYSKAEARQEADFVIDELGKLPSQYLEYMTLPVAYDLEDTGILNHCNKAQITKNMTIFCNTVRDAGYTPMVYSNTYWFTNYVDIKTAYDSGYKIWFAYYPNGEVNTAEKIQIGSTGYYPDMWQYSTTNETLDKNVLYTTMECEKHSFEKSVVAPSCIDRGYSLNTCTICGCTYKSNYTAVTGHSYSISSVKKATKSKNGTVVYTCSNCGNTKNEVIPSAKSIKLSSTSYTYDGKVKKPKATVTDSNGKVIGSSNYTVSYATGRKNVGKYKVTVKLKGNYTGTKDLYFNINPKGTEISSVTAVSKGFTAKWKKQSTQTKGYELQYSTSSKFKNAKTVKVAKSSTTSKKITKLSAKKKYYVRIRTYKTVGKDTYYSSWSKTKSIKTK